LILNNRWLSVGEKILVVEDDGDMGDILSHDLRKLGYDIIGVAADHESALKLVKEVMPDLVLMDIRLKNMDDGIRLSDEMLKDYGLYSVYVTVFTDLATIRKARDTQPIGYLAKPFTLKELGWSVRNSLKLIRYLKGGGDKTDFERARAKFLDQQLKYLELKKSNTIEGISEGLMK
jgi:two-component system, response regulator PdtaR